MKLFVDNFSSVGTQARSSLPTGLLTQAEFVRWQAALLSGFAFTSLAELNVPDDAPKHWKVLYFLSITITLASSLHCLVSTTVVTLFGPALALRSSDVRALERTTNGMLEERRQIFAAYWTGLISFQIAVIGAIQIVASETPWIALGCTLMLASSIVAMGYYAVRIHRRFEVKKDDQISYLELEPGIGICGGLRPNADQIFGIKWLQSAHQIPTKSGYLNVILILILIVFLFAYHFEGMNCKYFYFAN